MKIMRLGIMTLSFKIIERKLLFNIHQRDLKILTRLVELTSINLIEMFELFTFLCNKDQELRQQVNNTFILDELAQEWDAQTKLSEWGDVKWHRREFVSGQENIWNKMVLQLHKKCSNIFNKNLTGIFQLGVWLW